MIAAFPSPWCVICGKQLNITPESDAKARAELAERFGHKSTEDCSPVCDDCYQRVMEWLQSTDGTVH